MGVNVPGDALAVDLGRVSAFPKIFAQMADTAGAPLADLAGIGLEIRAGRWLFSGSARRWLLPSHAPVDLSGGGLAHLIGDVGVGIQRRGR